MSVYDNCVERKDRHVGGRAQEATGHSGHDRASTRSCSQEALTGP